MRRRHMFCQAGMLCREEAAHMAGDTLAFDEYTDRGRRQEHINSAVHQSVRHRVEVPVDTYMIVNVHTGHEPLTNDERFNRQWLQGSSFDGFEQRPAGALTWWAKPAVIDGVELFRDRGVRFVEGEKAAMAKRCQHPPLNLVDRGLCRRLVARLSHPCRNDSDAVVAGQLVVC